MSKYAIQVEGLGKEYIIGGAEQRHDSFREMLTGSMMAPLRRLRKLGGAAKEEERFWALKDLTFDVEQGQVIGIIGSNGAGKSTLLKVLSRITYPSEGRVSVRGKLASLLEVGTGFHPELTGRENIFLNGAILGMTRREVALKFNEILAFADIEKFVDTPVKRYSSGMYVRLAFSVAAHLEADVLMVDEVLAVGDAEFQRRCLGKMREVSSSGRTVVFVSHNLPAIQTLCSRCIYLEHGALVEFGATVSVVDRYLSQLDASNGAVLLDQGCIELYTVVGKYQAAGGQCDIKVLIDFEPSICIPDLFVDFGLENENDVRLLQVMPLARHNEATHVVENKTHQLEIDCSLSQLTPGQYYCTIYMHSKSSGVLLHRSRIKLFRVPADDSTKEAMSPGFNSVLLPKYSAAIRTLT